MELIFTKRNGNIVNTKKMREFFDSLPSDGTFQLTSKPVNIRSLGQNNYYHYIVVPAVRQGLYDIGFDGIKSNEQAHEFLKEKFLKRYEHNRNNPEEVIELPGSTAKLTTVEFMAYIAEIQRFSAEYLGIVIPDPNTQTAAF